MSDNVKDVENAQANDSLLKNNHSFQGKSNNNNADKPEVNDNSAKSVERATWREILYEYSQTTTLHGLINVTSPQPFWIRRLLWLLLFLGGCVVFGIQVVTSVMYYMSWPVSVDVKINYNDTIIFPAVTICNQNAFRTSQAYSNDQYYLISNLFSAKHSINQSNGSIYNIQSNGSIHSHPPEGRIHNTEKMRLDDLYSRTGHQLADLVVSCTWDGRSCDQSNFLPTLTDFGLCYTFNSGRDEKSLFHATQTGSEGGLRLQLNIEQYEYMKGPNPGAGLKLQIHNQEDVAMVKDHGIAVPPGSHGFVAVKTVEVNNLKHPHGKCNDSVELQYFTTYTMSTCYTNCKQRYILNTCGCRDIYMPDPSHETPVCTVDIYQKCLLHALEDFKSNETCDCPIPCHRLMYDPTTSYASTSNFDIGTLLQDEQRTSRLQEKYIRAREIQQRVNPGVMAEDSHLIHSLNTTVESLLHAFSQLDSGLDASYDQLNDVYSELSQRIDFHLDRGLESVRYAMEHDFERGWDVFEERAFEFVCFDFYSVAPSVNRTLNSFNISDTSDRLSRELLYAPVQTMLDGKLELVLRAEEYMAETRHAVLTGEPLLTYRITKNRHYDMSYISLDILHSGIDEESENYEEYRRGSGWLKEGIGYLKEVGEEFVETGRFNDTIYEKGEAKFISGCRRYNYRLFMYEERVVEKPVKVCDDLIEDFERTNRTFQAAFATTIRKIHECKSLLTKTKHDYINKILDVSVNSSEYLENPEKLKTPLCREATNMDDTVRLLVVSFGELRSVVRELEESLYELKYACIDVWKGMLGEVATKGIYEHLYNDSVTFLEDEEQYDFFIKLFASMLRIKSSEYAKLRQFTRLEIVKKINGDLHGLVLDDVIEDLSGLFADISNTLDISRTVGDNDEQLLASFESLRTSLQKFQKGNEIDSNFYKENFMRLDVFMQELSYEEITQQKAYDIPRLLSDIGGSMGLFIGGSVLSVFEIVDVFAHNGVRMALRR